MKTVVISGATGNLGEAIAKKFLQEGYKVTGITSGKQKSSHNDENYEEIAIDLRDEEKTKAGIETILSKNKTIDVVVLTAGGFAPGKIADTKQADLQKQIALNFETTYNIAQPLFIQMLKQGRGHLFMTGARTGSDMHLSKGAVAYGLSKSLIFRLAELMNEEAKGTDVIVSVISPSTIDTPPNRAAMPDADFNKWVKPEEIADIVFAQTTFPALRETILKVYNKA